MKEQERQIRLKIKWFSYFSKTKNIAKTCRYFGISRPTFYYWLKRYKIGSTEALSGLSRRPHNSPRAINPVVIRKIIALRKKLQCGPHRIAYELSQQYGIKLSGKTIHKYLRKHRLNHLRA